MPSFSCGDWSQWLLLEIFIQKVFQTNVTFRYRKVKTLKKYSIFVISIFKVDLTIVPFFFLNFYSLVPKTEICLKHFLDKNPKKAAIVWWERSANIHSQWLCVIFQMYHGRYGLKSFFSNDATTFKYRLLQCYIIMLNHSNIVDYMYFLC